MLKFTDRHEWLKLDGDVVLVGITRYAADAAGRFINAELPKLGAVLKMGERAAVLVSALSAFEAVAPASGEIIEINTDVVANPASVNADPQGAGWLYRLCVDDAAALGGLMDEEAYRRFIAG